MIIRFQQEFRLPVAEVYPYFRTPVDWPRLFPFGSEVAERGGGWFAVPLRRFPFPLVTRIVEHEPEQIVRWVFKGFWRGSGEVRFRATVDGVVVEGYEKLAVRWLFFLSPAVEGLFLERKFRAVWNIGWHRLRKQEAAKRSSVS